MATKIDLSTITIERIIVHDIPKHSKHDQTIQPNCSEQESSIPDGLRSFFKDKIVAALSSDKCFQICFDPNNDSPVPFQVLEILNNQGVPFVSKSQDIAKRLFNIQMGVNAAGIVVMIYGKVNGFASCMILKLERDQGAQLSLDPATNSFNIKEVRDLMLTQKTKIFKVALFIKKADFNCKYDGEIMDYQIDVKLKKEISTYFIDKFLGCIAFEDPKVTTKNFYNYTRTYIDTMKDVILKAQYVEDLNSYIRKNTNMINPREFADDYLKSTREKDEYKNYLKTKNFKFSAFPKDIQLINNRIKKIVISFENDISIIGSKGTLKDKVKLEELRNGETRAVVVAKIRRII